MRRVQAGIVALAVLSASGQLSALHVHAYTDHDHPEHHHALAAHSHDATARPADGAARLEACDPGQHRVSLLFLCATPGSAHAFDIEVEQSTEPGPTIRTRAFTTFTDVRTHSPPRLTDGPLRAPPLVVPS